MRVRRGAVLLEVVIAVSILAIAGLAVVSFVSEASAGVRRARSQDQSVREAAAYLDVVTLWPRADLDRHLGARRQGSWLMTVHRTSPRLYDIAIADSTGDHELIHTTVFRREDPDNAR